jgi:hypothetical protein
VAVIGATERHEKNDGAFYAHVDDAALGAAYPVHPSQELNP